MKNLLKLGKRLLKLILIIFGLSILLYISLICLILIYDKLNYEETCIKLSDGVVDCFDKRLIEKGQPE